MEKLRIIAELGINHNGDLGIAKRLIAMANEAGCDAVKFQKRTVEIVYSPEQLATPRESPWGKTTRDQKQALEFGKPEYDEIDRYCREIGIDWFASAWDIPSLGFLTQYDLKYNKVASAMLTHLSFVHAIANERKETFISTGMSTLEEIDLVVEIFERLRCPYVLMHAVSIYPCANNLCNIAMITTLKRRYGCRVGYSGHEIGVLPSVLAVALGAEVIERHITFDRSMYGSDQSASLEQRGLELLVRDCHSVNATLGSGEKVVLPEEQFVGKKLRYFLNQ